MFKLDKDSPLPFYKQLAKHLTDIFVANNDNDRLPTERELSETYNVSRITVRNALNILEKGGAIERERGKGTFVSKEKLTHPITDSHSFSQVIKKSGNVPGGRMLRAAIQLPDEEEKNALKLSEGDYVVTIERVRLINQQPSAFEISHFKQDYSFLLSRKFDNESIYEYIYKEKGIKFVDVKRTIEIVYANKELASCLDLDEGKPLVLIKAITKDQYGNIAHLAYEYLIADKFEFEIY
jgi:GntR family transcriptional regulator